MDERRSTPNLRAQTKDGGGASDDLPLYMYMKSHHRPDLIYVVDV